MPQKTAEHYRNKIAVYLRWYQTHGYPQDIPDEQDNDLGSRLKGWLPISCINPDRKG
uniref:Co-activator of prophage gene expression IbrA n=1 Tax=Salmonella sp. 14 TaxID=1179812 RepID=I3W331_9ENTR|nr:Co-activator of prophage gene expression IbrA [Salmonella sp. 14]